MTINQKVPEKDDKEDELKFDEDINKLDNQENFENKEIDVQEKENVDEDKNSKEINNEISEENPIKNNNAVDIEKPTYLDNKDTKDKVLNENFKEENVENMIDSQLHKRMVDPDFYKIFSYDQIQERGLILSKGTVENKEELSEMVIVLVEYITKMNNFMTSIKWSDIEYTIESDFLKTKFH